LRSFSEGLMMQPMWLRAGFRIEAALLGAALLALALGAGEARSDQLTITMLANSNAQKAFAVLIPNFERVYPGIQVSVTYAVASTIQQIETTELAAGNAPDILATLPGRGAPTSSYELASDGYLAPLVDEPWTKRSLPLVISLSKLNGALYAFEPAVTPFGLFSNDALLAKLGLKVPQTFSQLLTLCQKAQAKGTVAVMFNGGGSISTGTLLESLAIPLVYAKDKHWTGKLRAGTVTFDGTPAWHQALQELIEMNAAGCFEPGVTGELLASAIPAFAQGQAPMLATSSDEAGTIDGAAPAFTYSFHPFPGGAAAGQTTTFVSLQTSLSINAHSSPQSQAAAKTFIDFVARPKQDALFAEQTGGLTQYEFQKAQVPAFMSPFASVLENRAYDISPGAQWWNANVAIAPQQNAVGLLTGQTTVDDVLNAMDAAWKQGPS
jgi:raffinose/stachyose/melibiose transport system substrate-binding protein